MAIIEHRGGQGFDPLKQAQYGALLVAGRPLIGIGEASVRKIITDLQPQSGKLLANCLGPYLTEEDIGAIGNIIGSSGEPDIYKTAAYYDFAAEATENPEIISIRKGGCLSLIPGMENLMRGVFRHALSKQFVGFRQTDFQRRVGSFYRKFSDIIYEKDAKRPLSSLLANAPPVSVETGLETERTRPNILEFVLLTRIEKYGHASVLDIATATGEIPVGLAESALKARCGARVEVKATDLTDRRFPKGREMEWLKVRYPFLSFLAPVDATNIPDEVISQADLVLVTGLFDNIKDDENIQHCVLWEILEKLPVGSFAVITPCCLPASGSEVLSGQYHGIAPCDLDVSLQEYGSPAFAVASALNNSGIYGAAVYTTREWFHQGRYSPRPMQPAEDRLLRQLIAVGEDLSPWMKILRHDLQYGALVVERKAVGPPPQIFRKGILE